MKRYLVLIMLSLFCGGVMAQSVSDVRINEVLVKNVDNYEDDYGHRESWLELYNAGYSAVNVGGCYLEVSNGTDTIRYRIPKGDARTAIPPQGYLVFFCEGTGSKGTFHTNFRLENNNRIAFYDQSGRGKPISEIVYDVNAQLPDVSIGYMEVDDSLVLMQLEAITPHATNNTTDILPQHEKFRRVDPYGVGMTITAMAVVFTALLLLYIIFRQVGIGMHSAANKRSKAARGDVAATVSDGKPKREVVSGEVIAAISLAMQQYDNDLHDLESAVLTINRVGRTYSPWSSKIYGLTPTPNKK